MPKMGSVRKIINIVCIAVCVITVSFFTIMAFWPDGISSGKEADPNSMEEDVQEPSFTVVIDAGHGGKDGGAVGTKSKVPEAGLNLEVAFLLKELLEAENIAVIMTRETEDALGNTKKADMQERKQIMNAENVDIIVSIHMNRFTDPSVSGPMVFYMKGSEEGQKLAECVIRRLCEAIDHPIRKANPGDYFVIRESPVTSVLVECGFLSNPSDEQKLLDPEYRRILAEGVAAGLIEYLQSTLGENLEENIDENDGEAPPDNENTDSLEDGLHIVAMPL